MSVMNKQTNYLCVILFLFIFSCFSDVCLTFMKFSEILLIGELWIGILRLFSPFRIWETYKHLLKAI